MSMMLFRVINLLIRTIAKPLVSWVTHYKKLKLAQEQSNSPIQNLARNSLILLGRKWNHYNILINRKLFKIQTQSTIVELSEDKALEKGAEVFSEVLVYSILIILPIWEWQRQSKISKHKEECRQQKIKNLSEKLEKVLEESEKLNQEINEINELSNIIIQKIKDSSNKL